MRTGHAQNDGHVLTRAYVDVSWRRQEASWCELIRRRVQPLNKLHSFTQKNPENKNTGTNTKLPQFLICVTIRDVTDDVSVTCRDRLSSCHRVTKERAIHPTSFGMQQLKLYA